MTRCKLALVVAALALSVQCVDSFLLADQVPEDALFNFTQLAAKYGHPSKEYDAPTEDGYILKVFRIPGHRGPVLILHGLMSSSDGFIIYGHTSLVVRLARAGYDVWVGNVRGNRYSRRHKTLDPKNPLFWRFSFHHQGVYDLTALIDVALNNSKENRIRIVGLSQGTTSTFVMSSMRPEYAAKIYQFVAIAPVAYLNDLKGPMRRVVDNMPVISAVAELVGMEEVPGYDSGLRELVITMCSQRANRAYCADMLFDIVGYDRGDYQLELMPAMWGQTTMGSSRWNLIHFSQLVETRRFQQFDHGFEENLRVYGSARPPKYDFSLMTMPTYLLSAKNDKLALPPNVALLEKLLPNVVDSHVMDSPTFNHLGFIWGRKGHRLTADYVLGVFEQGLQLQTSGSSHNG